MTKDERRKSEDEHLRLCVRADPQGSDSAGETKG
jgi:hypothetical protein